MEEEQMEFGHIDKNEKKFVKHPLIYPDTVEERLYQTTIAKTALGKNTLVVLPTALGKTPQLCQHCQCFLRRAI